MNRDVTLDDLVRGGPEAWIASNVPSLARALAASGDAGATHLKNFCIAVEAWRNDQNASDDEFQQRSGWIGQVANGFLQGLQPDQLADLASKLATLDDQLTFIVTLANRSSVRSRLYLALDECTTRFRTEVPTDQPADMEDWNRRWRTLVSLQGIIGRTCDKIAAVLNGSPKWLLVLGVENLGKISLYDNFHDTLAEAFVVSTNPDLPDAIACVLTGVPPQRLDDLLAFIARTSGVRERAAGRPDGPPPDAAHRLCARIDMALISAGAPDMGRCLRNFFESWRQHDDDQQNLMRAYLDAVPENHEDVFDFLTRHGTRPRGRALSDWGGPSVTMWTTGSMRASSIHFKDSTARKGPTDHELPSPDFDVRPVFRAVSVSSAIQLVRKQQNPAFAFAYLNYFSRHPVFERIASNIAADPDYVARWEVARDTWAAVVWNGVGNLARRSGAFKTLQERLQPILLPRLPSNHLRPERLRLPEAMLKDLGEIIEQRLRATKRIKELEDLARAAYALGFDERDRILAQIDARRFSEPSESEQIDSWTWCLVRLMRDIPGVVERIVENITPSRAGALARTQPAFELRDQASFSVQHRLALKTRLMTRWASTERDEVSAALVADLQRDFLIFFQAVVRDPIVPARDEQAPLTAGERWLDLVADLGNESIVSSYVFSLLTGAWTQREQLQPRPFSAVAAWVSAWFGRHQRLVADAIWTALEHRLEASALDGDVEAAATLACLSLPSPPERLRQFREHAVDHLRRAIKETSRTSYRGALGAFRTLLTNEAPDLLARLSDERSTET